MLQFRNIYETTSTTENYQQHYNENQNEQHHNQHHTQQQKNYNDSTSSTSTSINTEPGVFRNQEDLKRILREYQKLLGDMTANVGRYITELLNIGMEPDVIIAAIHETGWAMRPTPYYMRAILERYRRSGIRKIGDLADDKADFELRQDEKRERREWWEG